MRVKFILSDLPGEQEGNCFFESLSFLPPVGTRIGKEVISDYIYKKLQEKPETLSITEICLSKDSSGLFYKIFIHT